MQVLAELEALHSNSIGKLQISEKQVFEYFVQSGCGNQTDVELIESIASLSDFDDSFDHINSHGILAFIFQCNYVCIIIC